MYATRLPRKLLRVGMGRPAKRKPKSGGRIRFFAALDNHETGTIAREPRKSVGAPMRRVAPLILTLS